MKSKPVTVTTTINLVSVQIDDIRTDGGTQTRAEIDASTVAEYSEAMRAGAAFPPPTVFYDGTDRWLADGFHRIEAAKSIGVKYVNCDVRQGDRRGAILFSVGANASHGLRRSNADKKRAVLCLLGDEEWARWPQKKIAATCGVSAEYVSRVWSELKASGEATIDRSIVQGRDGKTRDVTKIGKRRPEREEPPPEPEPTEADLDENIEPVLIVGDDPKPVPREPEETRRWGDFELKSSLNQVIVACRECGDLVERLFAEADPRFAPELRARAEDSVSKLIERLKPLLPPDGRKADLNRSRFDVIAGGKS